MTYQAVRIRNLFFSDFGSNLSNLLFWRHFVRQLANFIFEGLNLPSFWAFTRLNFAWWLEGLFLVFCYFYRLFRDIVAVVLLGL